MPIIHSAAHECDPNHTVVVRCKYLARQLDQQYAVLTVGEALKCKLRELNLAQLEYRDFLLVRFGGFDNSLKFLQVIGKHLQGSGLEVVWTERNCFSLKNSNHILSGRSYSRGMINTRVDNTSYVQDTCLHASRMRMCTSPLPPVFAGIVNVSQI